MPNPNLRVRNSMSESVYSLSSCERVPSYSHSMNDNANPNSSLRRSLPYPQLFAIYTELINEWFQGRWLTFADDHQETYLTLDSTTEELLTTQTAIDGYYVTSGRTSLISKPECLLIRTKSKSKTLLLPNSVVSIDSLLDKNVTQKLLPYKLLAIICYSNETNSKLMFYKDKQSNYWNVFYDQSIVSPSHSNVLSDEQQFQLESFIQKNSRMNYINTSKFISPLSALCNHPIIYVYIPATMNH